MFEEQYKKVGRSFLIIVFSILAFANVVLLTLFFMGVAVGVYKEFEGILNLIVSIASLCLLGRAVIVLYSIFPRKGDSPNDKVERLKPLESLPWLAFCILFLIMFPVHQWINFVHSPIPNGDYTVDLEYRLSGDNGYRSIEESGIARFEISLGYDVDYEDYTYYDGAVERTGAKISSDTVIYIMNVDLPNFGEYPLNVDVKGDSGECEIEVKGLQCILRITMGDLTEKRLNCTLEDKINGIPFEKKIDFVLIPLLEIVAIGGFFYVKMVKTNLAKESREN